MKPVIIIGTGLAGYSLAREFRRLDNETPLVIITRDQGAYYSKPMLSAAFAQGKDAQTLISAPAAKMADTLKAEIRTQREVTAIDPSSQRLWCGADPLEYQSLVIATGATPIRLKIPGDGAEDILSVNGLEDYAQFRAALAGKARMAIIGPGLIGCEFANDLLHAEIQVAVIGPDPWPISGLLPEPVGRALEHHLGAAGVNWHLNTQTRSLDRHGKGYRLTLENGSILEVDLVLSAVGLRPDLTLARQAGLASQGGIVTDAYLRTSAPQVYALGDCAEVEGRNLPYVMPLMLGAKALAKTLTGNPTPVIYPTMPVAIKTSRYPVVVVPPTTREGNWHLDHNASGIKGRFTDHQGRLCGFVLTAERLTEKSALIRELEQG